MNWETDEWRSAQRSDKRAGHPTPTAAECRNGCHAMVAQTGGGGVCFVCGLTVTAGEL